MERPKMTKDRWEWRVRGDEAAGEWHPSVLVTSRACGCGVCAELHRASADVFEGVCRCGAHLAVIRGAGEMGVPPAYARVEHEPPEPVACPECVADQFERGRTSGGRLWSWYEAHGEAGAWECACCGFLVEVVP